MMNQTVSQTDLYVLIRKIVDGIVASYVDDLFGPDHESQPWSDVHKHLSQRIFNLIHNDFNHISALRQAEDAVFSIGETVYGELRYATSVNSIELSRRAYSRIQHPGYTNGASAKPKPSPPSKFLTHAPAKRSQTWRQTPT